MPCHRDVAQALDQVGQVLAVAVFVVLEPVDLRVVVLGLVDLCVAI